MQFSKKKIIIIASLVVFLILCFVLFSFLRIRFAKVEVTLQDNLQIEFLSKHKVSEFISSINGTIMDDFSIDTTEIGVKNITLHFVNDDHIKVKYDFSIEVVDTVAPLVWLSNSYTIYKDNDVDLVSKILCGDNEDNAPVCEVRGEYDYTTVGDYPLTFYAKDHSNNETSVDFTLHVIERPKKTTSNNTTKTVTNFSDIYQEYKNENTKIGLDISKWQGEVDFEKLKNAGVEFVILKVGGTKGTNGEYYVDTEFENNIKKANEIGLPVGIYFFSYADSYESSIEDAKWVLDTIKDYKIDLPIAFDWEDWAYFNEYNLSFFGLTNLANGFLDTVKEYGYKGMLYGSKNYLEKVWLETEYDTWLAHYAKDTNYAKDLKVWQICDDGVVDGIDGVVDIDIMYS